MKKILTFFAAAMMLCASVHAQATSGSCGTNATWEYDSGTLTISGTGEMDDFSYSPWVLNYKVKSIVIKEGVTRIGNNAFKTCPDYTSV